MRSAIAFLTRLPMGRHDAPDAGWFPLVGILLGLIYCVPALLLKGHLPSAMIAVLLLITDALLTGALHFDGLADTADGFGGGKNKDDILRIMRDHAIGSYGGLALAAIVALKVISYTAVLNRPAVLVLTPILGRWSILPLTAALPYARQSPSVIHAMGKRALIQGTVITFGALLAARSLRAWIAMCAVIAVTAAFGLYCKRRIGGITGDTLGANLELCECAALLAFIWH